MSSLQYSITRQLMRHAKFYNGQILPFFRSTPRFAVQAYCLRDNKELVDAITSSTATSPSVGPAPDEYLTLQQIIRKQHQNKTKSTSTNSAVFALNALRLLSTWQSRTNATNHRAFNLPSEKYKFEVGDIVQHSELHHVGVVAAKMPICFETEEWIQENLGSQNDYRLSQPWYLILVARHDPLPFDFVRYGSQLTHVAGPREPIGCHRMLPMFFSGFCKKLGRYIPREKTVAAIADATLQIRSVEKQKRSSLAKKQRLLDEVVVSNSVLVAEECKQNRKIVVTAFADHQPQEQQKRRKNSTVTSAAVVSSSNTNVVIKMELRSPQSSVVRRSKNHFASVSASAARQQQQQQQQPSRSASTASRPMGKTGKI